MIVFMLLLWLIGSAEAQPPANLALDVLAWDAPTSGGAIENYRVECREEDSGQHATPIVTAILSLPLSIATQGVALKPGDVVRCRVVAMNRAGETLSMNEVAITSGGRIRAFSVRTQPDIVIVKPGAPKNVRVVPTTDE